MAIALPDYVVILFDGYGETLDPSVQSTPMERGPKKYSIKNSLMTMSMAASLYFESLESANSFFNWYRNDLNRIGEFYFTHPGTGQSITCNFKDGSIGTLTPITSAYWAFTRNVTLEYLL